MPRLTIAFGIALVALGVGTYLGTGRASVTALIPAFFGIGLALSGALALRENWRKHAMHAAAAIGLLGALGSLSRAIPGLDLSEPLRLATASQLAMGVGLLVFLVLCVRSFIQARKVQAAS